MGSSKNTRVIAFEAFNCSCSVDNILYTSYFEHPSPMRAFGVITCWNFEPNPFQRRCGANGVGQNVKIW